MKFENIKKEFNKVKKPLIIFGKVIEWTIFVVLIGLFLIVVSPYLPTKNYFVTYVVSTGSMEPNIQTGSIALVKPITPEEVKKDDIITFASPRNAQQVILHRVIEVKKDKTLTFRTKGDNNSFPDNWVVQSIGIKGKYITSIPYIGHPAAFIKTKEGFIIMVVIPALILLLLEIKKIRDGINEEITKRTEKALKGIHSTKAKVLTFFYIATTSLLVFSFSARIAHALFSSSSQVAGVMMSFKDFVPPPAPILRSPPDNTIMTSSTLLQTWTKVTDVQNPSYIQYYYESCKVDPRLYGDVCPTFPTNQVRFTEVLTNPTPQTISGEQRIVKNASGAPDGTFWWRVRARDSAGNYSAWSEVWKLTLDNIKPTAPSWIRPANGSVTHQSEHMLFDWTDSTDANLAGYEYENRAVGGSTWKSVDSCGLITQSQFPNSQVGPSGTCIVANAATLSTNGQYYRRVRAKDLAGNYSNWSAEWLITKDGTAPISSVTPFAVTATSSNTFNVSYTATDSLAGVKHVKLFYRKNGGAWTQYGTTYTSSPISFTGTGEGTYEFYTIAEDYADDLTAADMANGSAGDNGIGNIESKAQTAEATMFVDQTAPLSVALQVSNSWIKSVENKINNGDFETNDLTGWTKAGDVQVVTADTITNTPSGTPMTINPAEGTSMARIGNSNSFVWENRLMQSFDSGAKSMSLNYNFISEDAAPFDDPGFFIRINGQEVFKANSTSVNPTNLNDGKARASGWQEFKYDFSGENDKINLAVYAGNTGDLSKKSYAYVDKITTYFVTAPAAATYTMSGSDNPGGSGIHHFEFNVDGAGWTTGNNFTIPAGGAHNLQYRSVDNAGNYSAIYTVRVLTDTIAPAAITDLVASSINPNKVTLSWTAPGNDGSTGKAAQYDVRYSTAPIDNTNFVSAIKVENVPSPKEQGKAETLEILGLNPATTYYFAIKTSDEAPNVSDISNIASTTTTAGAVVNSGDIIINELMWMGAADQWIELRNMTDHAIDLSGFIMTRYDGTSDVSMLTIPSGSIDAHGYFLISNKAANNSHLKDTVTVDLVDTNLNLSLTTLNIKLYSPTSVLVDKAWDGTAQKEGIYDAGAAKYYSMERTLVPGDGANKLTWYTCIDGASTGDFFDGGIDERGTPRAENRSENAPLPNQETIERPTETPTPTIGTEIIGPTQEPTSIPTPSESISPTTEPSPTETQQPTVVPETTNLPSPTEELEGNTQTQ